MCSCLLAFCCAGNTESTAVVVQFHRKQTSQSLEVGWGTGREYSVSHLLMRSGSEHLALLLVPGALSAVPPVLIPRPHLVLLPWHRLISMEGQPCSHSGAVPESTWAVVSSQVIYHSPSTFPLKLPPRICYCLLSDHFSPHRIIGFSIPLLPFY